MKTYAITILLLFNMAFLQGMEKENFPVPPEDEETSDVAKIENLIEQQTSTKNEEEDNTNLLLLVTQLGLTQEAQHQRIQGLEKMCGDFSKENKRLQKEIGKRNDMLDSIIQLISAQLHIQVQKTVRAESDRLYNKIKLYFDTINESREDADIEKEGSE